LYIISEIAEIREKHLNIDQLNYFYMYLLCILFILKSYFTCFFFFYCSVQDWDERRKKAVIRDYYKDLSKAGNERPLDTLNGKDANLTKQQKR